MELIKTPTTFILPELELVRPGVDRGLTTRALYGKEMDFACVSQVDFLGFSNLLQKAGGKAAEIVQDFYQTTEMHARIGARTDGDDGDPTIALFQYADTINIVARENGDAGIVPVVRATAHLLASVHGRGLPARAAITMGELWAISHREGGGLDGDFVSGPAIARAHEVETAQDWAGAIIDPDCKRLLKSSQVSQLRMGGWLVDADVPTRVKEKRATRRLLAVNWPRVLHVPHNHWLPAVLACANEPTQAEAAAWRKRRAAVEFYEQHGLGRNHAHDDDVCWLVTPSGKHLPLMPSLALTL